MKTSTLARAALAVSLAVLSFGGRPALAFGHCTDDTDGTRAIIPNAAGITGKFALPAEEAETLVVFAHGYGHWSDSWVRHMERTAAEGAIAFAVDYRGQHRDEDGFTRGWNVREGAQDMIDVARTFLAVCDSLERVVIYGVSMGGNSSGLAVAAGATRADGAPLFDYWVAGEPVANVVETYLEARSLAPALGGFVQRALEDIEAQHGGPIEENAASYVDGAVVTHAASLAAHLKGAAVVHAFDDGTVPYDQGRELADALRAAGLPTDMYNVVRRESNGTPDGSDNSTITENFLGPLFEGAGETYPEPLAGHGTESSQTQIVIQTGLDIVFAMIHGTYEPDGAEYVVDGDADPVRIA